MRILTKTLPALSFFAISMLAFCPGVYAQDAGSPSGASADNSVFASSDPNTLPDMSAGGLSSTNFSYSANSQSSTLKSDDGQSLTEDLEGGFLGLSLLSLFHSHSSSGSSDTSTLIGNRLPPPSPAAVPEASSVISLGLLLVLGAGVSAISAKKKKASDA